MATKSFEVFISGVEVTVGEGSYRQVERANENSELSFSVITPATKENMFRQNQLVEVYNLYPERVKTFGGTVGAATFTDLPVGGKRIHTIDATDNTYFVRKRVASKRYDDFDTLYYPGEIVKDLLDTYVTDLAGPEFDEGIRYTVDSIDIGEEPVTSISFNYISVADSLDKLAEQTGFIWWVDENKVLYFKKSTTMDSGRTLTYSDFQEQTLIIDAQRKNYRNTQIIKGGMGITSLVTETFKLGTLQGAQEGLYGSTSLNITLSNPISGPPESIHITESVPASENGTLFNSTIHKRGEVVEEEDFDYIRYQKGSETLILTADLAGNLSYDSTIVTVKYYGLYPIVVKVPSDNEVLNVKQLEGGSGIVEAVDIDEELTNEAEVHDAAAGKLRSLALAQIDVEFTTHTALGLRPGHRVLLSLPKHLDDDFFVIDSIEIEDEHGYLWHTYKLTREHLDPSDLQVVSSGYQNSREDKNEMIPLVIDGVSFEYSKTWTSSDIPNIFQDTLVGSTVVGSTSFTSFDDGSEIMFVDVHFTNGDVFRKPVLRVEELNDGGNVGLTSRFSLATHEANGEWASLSFYGGKEAKRNMPGSGGHLQTVSQSLVKNNRTTVSIVRTDING